MAEREKIGSDALLDMLQKLLVVQLAQAGVDNHAIARIAGVHVRRVIPIATLVKSKMRKG